MKQIAVIAGGIFGLFVSLIGAYFVFVLILFPTNGPSAEVLGENEFLINKSDESQKTKSNSDISSSQLFENIKESIPSIVDNCEVGRLISTQQVANLRFEIREMSNCINSQFDNQWVLSRITNNQTTHITVIPANTQGELVASPTGSFVVIRNGQEFGACKGIIGWNVYNGDNGELLLDSAQFMIGQGDQIEDVFIADNINWISDSQFQFRSLNWTHNECSSHIIEFDTFRDQAPIITVTI